MSFQTDRVIKGILFDMDGTLIESMDIWYEILRAASIHFGAEPLVRDVWRPTYGQSLQANVDLFMPHVSVEDLDAYCTNHFAEHTDKIFVLDQAPDVVHAANKHTDAKICIVTNCPRKITQQIVDGDKATFLKEAFGWTKIVCALDPLEDGAVVPSKPDPTLLKIGAEKLGLKTEECMMVGDSKFDILAGKAAGCYTVGINAAGGDVNIKSIAELLEVIKGLPKNQ